MDALSLGSGDSATHSVLYQASLELRYASQKCVDEFSHRRRCVNAFAEGDEINAQRLELLQRFEKMLSAASKPIELPDYHSIELSLPCLLHQVGKCRSVVYGSRYADIFKHLNNIELAALTIPEQVTLLVLCRLLIGGDTAIKCDSHRLSFHSRRIRVGWK